MAKKKKKSSATNIKNKYLAHFMAQHYFLAIIFSINIQST